MQDTRPQSYEEVKEIVGHKIRRMRLISGLRIINKRVESIMNEERDGLIAFRQLMVILGLVVGAGYILFILTH